MDTNWRDRMRIDSDWRWAHFRADMDDTFHRQPGWVTDMDRRFADSRHDSDLRNLDRFDRS